MSNLFPDISGRVYVVTGASRGVGVEICRALHARGARVALLARTQHEIDAHAERLGERALAAACDVGDRASVDAAIGRVVAHFGGIDGVVNNAGLALIAPVEKIRESDLAAMLRVNVQGPLNLIQATLPHLRARGGGHILNISSTIVDYPEEFPFLGSYALTKAALERLTVELRIEASRANIAVTLFRLGSTLTHFGTGWDPEIAQAAFVEWDARGGSSPATMDPRVPAEMIVRCLEAPRDACADIVQFRPYAEIPKSKRMAD